MNTDFAKSLGILPLSYIEFRSFVKKSIPMSSRTANTSIGMLSGPIYLMLFRQVYNIHIREMKSQIL